MQIFKPYFISLVLCITHAVGFSHANAQAAEAAPDAEMPTVQVTGVRDPQMMPYKDAYEILTRLREVGKDRIEFKIRVISRQTQAPIKGLELSLSGPNTFEKVPVSENGFVKVPLEERFYADKAEFVTNQKKGTVGVNMSLLPKLPVDQFSYADIVETIEAGQRVRKELIPWYLRLFVPSLKAVAICYPDSTRQVTVSNAPMPVRPATTQHKDGAHPVYCADFEAGDRLMSKDSVIAPAPGWRAIYL